MYRALMGEDAYWERRREMLESPRKAREDEDETRYRRLYLDGQIEKIENERGCTMEELPEEDLLEIVKSVGGIIAVSAEWNSWVECIVYQYRIA